MKLNPFVLAGFACATLLSATTSFAQDSAAAGHKHARAGGSLAEPRRGAPVGAVLDDDQLPAIARIGLGLQARPQPLEVPGAVVADQAVTGAQQ